ncbi:hypothetical protein ACEN9D_12120 [Pseudomonas sp. CT11-2]|uniref:hypothetical protein n=1 Tax=unclassified Pseudomonas TaxID=196821 RepID=UPI002161074C|nr:hypothetical protein [Pseudomonas sp. B21-019]UVM34116.1 hypothetical protein LOY36_05220 [Pseudomonas sp. B21-019]
MNTIKKFGAITGWVLAGLFSIALVNSVNAVTLEMSAVFRPDPANAMRNVFENTTPQGGHCKDHPTYCAPGVFSIGVPIRFKASAPIEAKHEQRQGPMFQLPSSWKEVAVINDSTGDSAIVKMRISGMGAAYTIKEPLLSGHWTTSWGWPNPPCVSGGVSYGSPFFYAFFWQVPLKGGVCSKQAQLPITENYGFAYQSLSFSYEMQTPSPLEMITGTYRGVLNYTVGPHGDFDMGDIMLPDDELITLNFTLSVEHTLKVDVPPGGNRIELVPQGGWQAWLSQGRRPARLFRDQTFNISSSSRFKMEVECQHTPDNKRCGVVDPVSGQGAELNVSISLPHGLTTASGQPVNRMPLLQGDGIGPIVPGFYVDRKPGTLHFEIPSSSMESMIRPGRQRQYSGSVTVIWDSEVG